VADGPQCNRYFSDSLPLVVLKCWPPGVISLAVLLLSMRVLFCLCGSARKHKLVGQQLTPFPDARGMRQLIITARSYAGQRGNWCSH
jgi:hypothetical protein